ncbi:MULTISPECIES: hypothetical protein [Streptomyces]|uniref:Uncharacterized protein n=1 Tax=Streptomyces nondiastaticus TaxID=3154512 RepID=A0ABW6TRP5_9ACTN
MHHCHRFRTIRTAFEREIAGYELRAERAVNSPMGRSCHSSAQTTRHAMARALNRHLGRCRECG